MKVSFRGGCLINEWSTNWPFARLTADDGAVVLSMLRRKYSLEKSQITAIVRYRGLATTPGLQLKHAVPDVPQTLVFFPLNPRKVHSALTRLGYTTEDM